MHMSFSCLIATGNLANPYQHGFMFMFIHRTNQPLER